MAKGRRDYPTEEADTRHIAEEHGAEDALDLPAAAPEVSTAQPPAGLKELAPHEAALKDGWERRNDGLWVNRRSFNVPGGVVPQGVARNTEEAYALEVRRVG